MRTTHDVLGSLTLPLVPWTLTLTIILSKPSMTAVLLESLTLTNPLLAAANCEIIFLMQLIYDLLSHNTLLYLLQRRYTANYNQTQRVYTPCVIQFTSDSSVTRPGFQISIAPVSNDCNRPYTVETFHSNSTDGTHRFPANGAAMYQGSARGLSVVQATPDLRNRAVSYGMVDLEEPNDWTQMFMMGPYTRANPCTAWER